MTIGGIGASFLNLRYTSVSSGTYDVPKAAALETFSVVDPSAKIAGGNTVPADFAGRRMSDDVGQTLLSLQETNGASGGPVIETVNGIDVIVSGHSVDAREGVSMLRTYEGSLTYTPEILAQLEANADITIDGRPALTEISSVALEALPAGSTSYMDVTRTQRAGRLEPDFLSDYTASYRESLEDYMKVVEAERQLKSQHGDDVKLIYSHTDGGYIMLTPDDPHYGEMSSAEDAVGNVISDVNKGIVAANDVRDILQRYGYTV